MASFSLNPSRTHYVLCVSLPGIGPVRVEVPAIVCVSRGA
jgi:hypothetical protein